MVSADETSGSGETELTPEPPAKPVRVAWMAGARSVERLGRSLQPLAIGLMDELVEIVAFAPDLADVRELPCPPVELLRYGPLRRWGFTTRSMETISGEIRARKIQLIHALDPTSAPLARTVSRELALPYLVSSYRLGAALHPGRLGRRVAAVLAGSEPVRQDLARHHVTSPEKIHLFRPGVYQVRHATCFTDARYSATIVAVGAMDDFNAWRTVLECFADLHARKRDCAFFLIGNGRAEHQLRLLAEKLKIQGDITFADRQPYSQLAGIFKAADVCISPARSRGVDMSVLLAMAAGVPVLSAGDEASDFLIDGRTVLLYPAGHTAELTVKLTGLLDDHAGATALAESALAHLRERHSPARAVTSMANLYRRVVAEGTFVGRRPTTAGAA